MALYSGWGNEAAKYSPNTECYDCGQNDRDAVLAH